MHSTNKTPVLIVDDHPIFRSGLASLINTQPDLVACSEAASAPLALETMRTCPADVAVLEVRLPGTNGIELIKMMRAEQPRLRILMLSMCEESIYAPRALRAGALGYVMKTEAAAQVLEALNTVARGEIYVSPKLSEQFLYGLVHGDSLDTPLKTLSPKELKVFQLFGRGLGTKAVAAEFDLSVKTIETHRRRIIKKLRFKKADEMVRHATNWLAREESGLDIDAS